MYHIKDLSNNIQQLQCKLSHAECLYDLVKHTKNLINTLEELPVSQCTLGNSVEKVTINYIDLDAVKRLVIKLLRIKLVEYEKDFEEFS